MTLPHGTKLGPYEVIAPLGSGGMGVVYRARDPRLGRDVALKVLPAERLSDPARRARFEQEARAVARLNHSHIVTIHAIEEAEGVDFIVMELVPGKTLDALIPRQGMRLGEALRLAIPLADALAAAHAAGIVHRDLKPGNVMVTPDGVVKVLDFGLAKLAQGDDGGSEDSTTADARARLSRPGAVLGTPAYMSPEQAAGGAVDTRSDIFSFGAVLYEMVTGRRPFAGRSSVEMLAALLKEQPKPPSELVPDLPKELERIILRCLRKESGRRFQNMLDVKIELLEVKEESDSQALAGGALATRRSRRYWLPVAIAVGLVAAAASVWRLRPAELPSPTVVALTSARRASGGSFSPDGMQIAFSSTGDKGDNLDVWLKIVGEAESRRLTTDPAADGGAAWSPDGKQIAFVRATSSDALAGGVIHLVSPLGGPERRLVDFPAGGQLSWSPDGLWLAAAKGHTNSEPAGGVHLISAAAGETRAVTFPKALTFDVCPAFSPDGRALAYATCEGSSTGAAACDIHVQTFDDQYGPRAAARRLTRQGGWVQGVAWTRDGRSIVYGINEIPNPYLWRVRADGSAPPDRVELAGRGSLGPSTAGGRDRLLFTRSLWDVDVWRVRLGSAPAPLIESTFNEMYPQYSPDGLRIAFGSGRSGERDEIWLTDADGSNPTRLTHGPGRAQGSPRWAPDGRSIAFDSVGENGRPDIWTIRADGSGLRQVTHGPEDEILPSWSRDGRWVYFTSNRTGRNEVWRASATGQGEEQVTREGGCAPAESRDGRTLYYLRGCQSAPLFARPTGGGGERTVVPCVDAWNYGVGPHGVFHADCAPPGVPSASQRVLRYWDEATGQDRPVATLESAWVAGVTVSPDGRSILWGRSTLASDLVMIENFR